jgi:hypothetical protein
VAEVVAFIFFYDLPSKLDKYDKATARMRVQQSAMMKEAQHLESERRLLEHEKKELREERDKLEKARIPPGAFWEVVSPAWDCRAYGTREYWGILRNVPKNQTDLDACMNMPVEIKGATLTRPHRCAYVDNSPHVHGFWMVDWNQTDCKPWHKNVADTVSSGSPHSQPPLTNTAFKGCTNPGSGVRRIEAWVMGINDRPEQDWRLLCETTPLTWKHITYDNPTHCEARVSTILTRVLPPFHMLTCLKWLGMKYAMWDVPDKNC